MHDRDKVSGPNIDGSWDILVQLIRVQNIPRGPQWDFLLPFFCQLILRMVLYTINTILVYQLSVDEGNGCHERDNNWCFELWPFVRARLMIEMSVSITLINTVDTPVSLPPCQRSYHNHAMCRCSDDDDTAELLAELQRIKKERAQEEAKKVRGSINTYWGTNCHCCLIYMWILFQHVLRKLDFEYRTCWHNTLYMLTQYTVHADTIHCTCWHNTLYMLTQYTVHADTIHCTCWHNTLYMLTQYTVHADTIHCTCWHNTLFWPSGRTTWMSNPWSWTPLRTHFFPNFW